MIIKNVTLPPCSSRNTSPSKFRSSMIRTSDAASEPPTTKAPLESSPSFAPCRWDWMRGGTRSSLTSQISREGHTEATTSRHSELASTPIVASDASISQIDFTQRRNSLQSSSFSCPSRSSNEALFVYIIAESHSHYYYSMPFPICHWHNYSERTTERAVATASLCFNICCLEALKVTRTRNGEANRWSTRRD